MKSICIFSSELATIIGINRYQTIYDTMIKIWQRSFKEEFELYADMLNLQPESDRDFLKRIQSELGIEIDTKIKACMDSKTNEELLSLRKMLYLEIDTYEGLAENLKIDIKKAIESVTNKNFGIINEINVIDIYSREYGKRVKVNAKFVKKDICIYNKIRWSIGGRIDGITEDGIVVEVKNRIYKMFIALRDYEKPQLQSYIYILGLERGHLVESFGGKINVIDEVFDEDYWKDTVMYRINNFIKIFHLFLENNDFKKFVILTNKDEVEQILINNVTV